MPSRPVERRVDELVRRCYAGLDSGTLMREVIDRLRRVVTIDAAFFATVDPATMLFTSAVSEEPLVDAATMFLANELGGRDVNRFVELASGDRPLRALDEATGRQRGKSERYATIMRPLGLGDELRVVLRTGGSCWGVMCLHREDGPAGFAARDAAIVSRLAAHVAEGLRRATLLEPSGPPAVRAGHGIVIVDHAGRVVSMNDAAEQWLAEIPDPDWPAGELPLAIFAVVAAVTTADGDSSGSEATVRLRTARGVWLSVHASRLHGTSAPQVVVVLEPAEPAEVVSLVLAGHAVTGAQARVVALVLRGYSTRQIVNELEISPYTVQEHLKGVFDRFGVRSRRELAAALLHRAQ